MRAIGLRSNSERALIPMADGRSGRGGWWRPQSKKLSYTIVHAEAGRIFGLDLGSVPHLNPSGEQLVGGHMHIWVETDGDQAAFPRGGVGYSWENPLEVWQIFCAEVNLVHHGRLLPPILRTEMR